MNEAKTKIVKQYIEMMEREYKKLHDTNVRFYFNEEEWKRCFEFIRSFPHYTALKALVEDKPSRTIKSSGTTGKASREVVREAVKAIKDKPDAERRIAYSPEIFNCPNCHDGDTYTHSYRCYKHQYKPASSSIDKPSAEGWIKWETPGMDEEVELKHKDGEIKKLKANVVNWHNSNIIAYRIVGEPKKPKKQTLLEFFYEGQETCGVVERNLISKISEWAELYLENKED